MLTVAFFRVPMHGVMTVILAVVNIALPILSYATAVGWTVSAHNEAEVRNVWGASKKVGGGSRRRLL